MATIYGTAYGNTLRGSAYADSIYGRGGNDVLYGNGGNDTLDGGTGADKLYGGIGNDTYIVDTQFDDVLEFAGQGIDTVLTSTHHSLAMNVENLATTNALGTAWMDLSGNGLNNIITGNNGANGIFGGAGADTLLGGGGNDSLRGGTGSDRLTGGAGSDWFVFDDRQSRDTITDFASGIDKIDLGWFVGTEFRFIGSAAFSGQAGQGRFSSSLFQLDLNGDRIADMSITILGGTVRAGDFIFGASGAWDY